jgi:predicted regulator of Ras-like GTPase activity (Roadblock/LC7/MglB family)
MAEANLEVTAQLVSGQAVWLLDFTPMLAHRSTMATIRDLVSTLRRRDGVEAAIVLGRDGLLIDGASTVTLDPEGLAAHVPPMVAAAIEMGHASSRGDFGLMVLEYGKGIAIVTSVSPDALLLVLLNPSANLAALLFDLRRHRAQIAALV